MKLFLSYSKAVGRAAVLLSLLCACSASALIPHIPGTNDNHKRTIETEGEFLAESLAKTALNLWGETGPGNGVWNYEQGVLLCGFQRLWLELGDDKYFDFMQRKTDEWVQEDGSIATYDMSQFTLDNILPGRNVLFLWKQTGLEKYRKAAELLRSQLLAQNRSNEGGFWYKAVLPYQMWVDGLYMAQPFYAEYAAIFNEPADFDDIAKQFMLAKTHLRDPLTGLMYHGYDELKLQAWSDPKTGHSASFWGRGDGWYAMALVDTLDYFPLEHPKRRYLLGMLRRFAEAIREFQDPVSGVWWEVLDKGEQEGNYLESSASAMFVYAIAKSVRLGYLPQHFHHVARTGYTGIVKQFVTQGSDGGLNYTKTVVVGSLAGDNDGSYACYLKQPVVTNDAKGIGPFLMASMEIYDRRFIRWGGRRGLHQS